MSTDEILRAQRVIAELVHTHGLELPRVEYEPADPAATRGDGPGYKRAPVRTSATLHTLTPAQWHAWACALTPHPVRVERKRRDRTRVELHLCTVEQDIDVHVGTTLTRDMHPDATRVPVQWARTAFGYVEDTGWCAHRDAVEHVAAVLALGEAHHAAVAMARAAQEGRS